MKKYSFRQIIGLSFKRTALVLFKPYSLKKWIMLLAIIYLAGYLAGTNLNFNLGKGKQKIEIAQQRIAAKKTNIAEGEQTPVGKIKAAVDILRKNIPFMLVLILILALAGIIIPLWLFIKALFHFIFIESLVRNDASVKIPFHRNKSLGKSYFCWNIIFGTVVALLVLGTLGFPVYLLFKAGAFSDISSFDIKSTFSNVSPYLVVLVLFSIIALIIRVFVTDFVTVMMYYKQTGIKKAWADFIALSKANAGSVILYLLVKLGLSILSIFAFLILLLISILFLLVAGGGLALMGWLITVITPAAAKPVMTIILLVLGVPLYAFLFLVTYTFFIPLPVFFRLFSMYFLASIEEPLDNLLKQDTFLTSEEETKKYKKPLVMLWTAMLLPIMLAALIVLDVFLGGISLAGDPRFSKSLSAAVPGGVSAHFAEGQTTVCLKNGRILKGIIEEEDEKNITIRMRGGTLTFNKKDIKSIKHDTAN